MERPTQQLCSDKLDIAINALAFVLSGRDEALRQIARRSLAAIGEPAIPALALALKDRNKSMRWEAAKALSEIHSPEAIPVLIDALEDELFGIRWLAAEGLVALGLYAIRPLVEAYIRDPESSWLRDGTHHVLKVLADKGYAGLVRPLVDAMEDYTRSDEIIPAARSVLARVDAEEEARSQQVKQNI